MSSMLPCQRTIVLVGIALAGVSGPGCAEERPPITRVQPNVIDKSMLDGEWYAQVTVVEVPAAVTPVVVGAAGFPSVERIRWDIQENTLYARRAYELVENSEADDPDAPSLTEEGEPYLGAIVSAWRIESHFDIVREYNPTTGEEINVIVENSRDRPWHERRYMRVDWSENLATNFSLGLDSEVETSSVPFYVQEDGNEDDRPHFEDGYFDVTTQAAVAPRAVQIEGWPDPIPLCWFFYRETEDCATTVIKVRNSYLRVDPERQYEPEPYRGTVTEAFGFFAVDRLHRESHNGIRETDRRRYLTRFNIWQRWRDDSGAPIPPTDREVRPIVYHLNADWPEELRGVAEAVADEWNDAFRDVVRAETGWSEEDTPDVFILCPNDPVQEGDRPECGEPGTRARLGDIRFSHVYWVKDWYDGMRLLGMGPPNADPLTGEILSGNAHIYLYNDEAATTVEEMVRLLNGEMDPLDYIDGVDLERWVEGVGRRDERDERALDDSDVGDMYSAMDHDWMRRLPRAEGRQLPAEGIGRATLGPELSALRRSGAFDASRDPGDALLRSLRGSEIESLLVNDEMRMAAGWSPDAQLTEEVLDSASITRSPLVDLLGGIERWRIDLGRRGWDVAEMTDDAMVGLAESLRGRSSEEVWRTARETIVHAVLAHELGHSLGLMHNFAGSEDVLNYDPEYWRLRTDDFTRDPLPRYLDPVTDEQLRGRIYDRAYSSIMDYAGRLTIDGAGIGRYDRAAILYGYAGLAEVYEDVGDATEEDLAQYWASTGGHLMLYQGAPQAFHYTEWYRRMGDRMWRDDNRRLVPVSTLTEDLAAWEDPDTGERFARVPYLYCSHSQVDLGDGCLTRDFGADPYERMDNHIRGLNTWYLMRSFSRSRYGFNPATYFASTYGRSYDRMKGFNDTYALWAALLDRFYTDEELERFFTDPTTGWGGYTVAVHDAFNQLARTLTMPDIGGYAPQVLPDGVTVLQPGFLSSLNLDVTRARYFTTAWWDTGFDRGCGYYWWECLHHVGFFFDKVMALLVLSDAGTNFVARDTAEDVRLWRISFFDNFATQITDLAGGILAQNTSSVAPYLDTRSGEFLERDYASPVLDPVGDDPVGTLLPVDPATGFTVQLYTAVLGAARFHNNFDNRFTDSVRMWLGGNGHSVEAPTISYTDPTTGFRYEALDLPNGISARVLEQANLLKARTTWCDAEDPDAPDACVDGLRERDRDEAEGALILLRDNLDILVDLTGHMDSVSDTYL